MKIHHYLLLSFCLFYWQASAQAYLSHNSVIPATSAQFGIGNIRVFDEVEKFPIGTQILQFGLGLRDDINIEKEYDNQLVLPGVSLLWEKAYFKNLGIGIKAGARLWKIPKLNYNYRYLALGLRGNYHFNLHPRLDPYLTLSANLRQVSINNRGQLAANWDTDLALSFGARYYLNNWFAANIEAGADMLAYFHLGFAIKIR